MPDLSSRIRAAAPSVVMLAMAGMVAWNASIASAERTLADRVKLAEAEARKAQDDLKAEQLRNAAAHSASLEDRQKTKGELKAAADVVASNAKRIGELEARLKALEAKE